jgi:hypothetical protein
MVETAPIEFLVSMKRKPSFGSLLLISLAAGIYSGSSTFFKNFSGIVVFSSSMISSGELPSSS